MKSDTVKSLLMLGVVGAAGWVAWRAWKNGGDAFAAVSDAADYIGNTISSAYDKASEVVKTVATEAKQATNRIAETTGNVLTGTWTAAQDGFMLRAGVQGANWSPYPKASDAGFGNLMATYQGWRYYDTGYAKGPDGAIYYGGEKLT